MGSADVAAGEEGEREYQEGHQEHYNAHPHLQSQWKRVASQAFCEALQWRTCRSSETLAEVGGSE